MYESREVIDDRFRKFVTEFLDEVPKPFPEGVRVGTMAFIVEIERVNAETGETETSEVWYRCSDPRPWVQAGFLRAASRLAEFEDEGEDEDEEDAEGE